MTARAPEQSEIIARICHQTNKAWCEANGDFTQKDWENAEQWQRDSAIKGVEFRIQNPDSGPDAQHNAWMKEKTEQGWIFGETKDAEAKTHPCIIPYEQLPEFQRKKDALFCAIVDALKFEIKSPKNKNFGEALKAIQSGKRIAREGWNGKGMFAVLSPGKKDNPSENFWNEHLKKYAQLTGGTMTVRPAFMLKTAQEDVAYWTPSTSDILAEDWIILED
jgi:hypothetical protein